MKKAVLLILVFCLGVGAVLFFGRGLILDYLDYRFISPAGFLGIMAFDPYIFRKKIKAAFFIAVGTNDEFFALGAPNGMMGQLDGDKAFYVEAEDHHDKGGSGFTSSLVEIIRK